MSWITVTGLISTTVLKRINLKQFIKILIALFVCVFSSETFAQFEDFTLKNISVQVTGENCQEQTIRKLIPFYDGQALTPEQFDVQITKIKSLNLFSTVEFELYDKPQSQKELKLFLSCSPRIRNISVNGNYPFLSKDIIKLIPMQPGSAYDKNLVLPSQNAVNSFLEKNGFYESNIQIIKKPVKDEPSIVDLKIKIKKNRTYYYRDVTFTGNSVYSSRRLRNIVKHWGRYEPQKLKEDVEHIKEIYAKKGYVKARVKVEQITFDRTNNKVDIALSIRENRKLTIKIVGNPFYPPSRLKDVTKLYERRSYDRYALRLAEKRLVKYYKKNGFLDPQISTQIKKPSKKEIVAEFTIEPGQQVQVKKVLFEGNESISKGELKKVISTEQNGLFEKAYFNEELIQQDRFKLLQKYKTQGYFDAFVNSAQIKTNEFKDQKTVTFKISEGDVYKIKNIVLIGNQTLSTDKLIKISKLKVNKAYSQNKIIEGKNRILDELQRNGFAYATVESQTDIHREDQSLTVTYTVSEGPVVHINSISIFGNIETREDKIRDTIRIKKGDLFNYQTILDAQLRLRRLGVFRSVRLIPMGYDSGNPTIDVVVNVTERKSIIINVQAGYDNRYLATGQLGLTKLNLFGSGNQFSTRLIGGPRYNRAEMTFFFPQIFGASWNLTNQYFGQYDNQPNFTAISAGGYVNTLKNFGPNFSFGFQEQVTRTDLIDSKSNVSALGNSLFDNTFNEFSILGIIDFRDNFADPQKGFYIQSKNEFSTDLSDIGNQFNTIEVNLSHYLGFFNKRFTLVNSLRYGHILGVGHSPRVPANKLFFLGGADTLRGFTEDGVNPSGGTVSLIYNTELHLKIRDSFKIAGFFDMGALGDNLNGLTGANVRESTGVGLRYFTPLGPVRLDWGFILNRQPGEPRSRVHFSFGYFY